ncbi:phosphoglycerate mutase 1 family protein [Calothrix parasitica NIES-267]|uniref:Phosphoglycerate mutase 1 family protein n=1 Tax=Calothrix parasitica NIES-267 TaxID=1973488 RepID=A0A1Z4LSJ3_9CYAN|nr:phosphoglycerate mutase 1 family protein [Calothrix parasitica NIES-267]
MELDKLEPEQVPNLELATGQPIAYDVDQLGNVSNKLILQRTVRSYQWAVRS